MDDLDVLICLSFLLLSPVRCKSSKMRCFLSLMGINCTEGHLLVDANDLVFHLSLRGKI